MSSIIIDLDLNKEVFLLKGDIEDILSDIVIKFYLKDYLKADFSNKDKIIVPFEKETKEKILKKIRELLSRYSLSEEHTQEVKEDLDEYFKEEKNFEKFSKKANDIRNNHCDKTEFKEFINALEANMNRRLYPLQLLSAYHLAFSQNACNFSVPGSGKTSIVYGAYTYLKNLPDDNPKHVDRILVIGPLSSFSPWEQEYLECFGRKAHSKRLHGVLPKRSRINYLYSSKPAELTLISYQGLPTIIEDLRSFLKRNKVMVVLDEAHRIKNVEGGIIAETALSLSRFSFSRVILTGTPLPNGYQDLYNLYKFIWPNKEIIDFSLFQLKEMSNNPSDKRVKQLIKSLAPFFIRIKKSDLKLPKPINHPPVSVEMGPIQKDIYDYIESKYLDYFIARDSTNSFKNILAKARVIRLMQAATNPALLKRPLDEYFREQGISDSILIDDSEILRKINSYESLETPRKFVVIGDLVKKIIDKGGKVVIWATFVQNIHELRAYLRKQKISSKVIYGEIPVDFDEQDTNLETREKIINEFHKENSSFNVLIANPFSVAESISLHKACHNAIYLERTFNAGHFIQSKDRIHRYGLKSNVKTNYYYLLSENSIDQSIHARLSFKERRMNEIIEKEPIPLFFNLDEGDLADKDIKQLIDDYVKRSNRT